MVKEEKQPSIEDRINYTFSNPVRDVPILQRGNRFFQALPYVRFGWLVDDTSNNTLYNYVSEEKDLGVFFELMMKSSNPKLLAAAGPYTVFAPSNFAFSKSANPSEKWVDSINPNKRDEILLRHIFLGDYGKEFSGNITNLLGEVYTVRDGRIIIEHEGKQKAIKPQLTSIQKSNGYISIISSLIEDFDKSKSMTSEKLTINVEPLVSEKDIAMLTYHIWKKQNEYDVKSRISIKEQLSIIMNRLEEHEQEVEDLEDVGAQLLALNERYNDYLHQAEVKVENDRMTLRLSGEFSRDSGVGGVGGEEKEEKKEDMRMLKLQIAKLSKKYVEHVRSSSQLNALEKSLHIVSKDARDM